MITKQGALELALEFVASHFDERLTKGSIDLSEHVCIFLDKDERADTGLFSSQTMTELQENDTRFPVRGDNYDNLQVLYKWTLRDLLLNYFELKRKTDGIVKISETTEDKAHEDSTMNEMLSQLKAIYENIEKCIKAFGFIKSYYYPDFEEDYYDEDIHALGFLEALSGNIEGAIRCYNNFLDDSIVYYIEEDGVLFSERAYLKYFNGDKEGSLKDFQNAFSLDPDGSHGMIKAAVGGDIELQKIIFDAARVLDPSWGLAREAKAYFGWKPDHYYEDEEEEEEEEEE